MRAARSSPVIGIFLLASGCAFIDKPLPPPSPPVWTQGLDRGHGREVVLVPIADRRKLRSCGYKKDGYGRVTANFVCTTPPGRWLEGMVAEGLAAAGFKVAPASNRAAPGALVVSAALEDAFVEAINGLFAPDVEADVQVTVGLSTASGLMARRSFYVKTQDTFLFDVDGAGQYAFDTAVREMVTDMVGAVANLAEALP